MKTIERDIHIDVPPASLYDFIDNTANAPAWIPSMLGVRNIKGTGKGKTYEWTYRMAGVKLDGQSEVTAAKANEHYQTRSTKGIKSTWDYRIEADGEGSRFRLKVQYEIPTPVLRKFAENLLLKRNERETEMAMKNIKEMVEHSMKVAAK